MKNRLILFAVVSLFPFLLSGQEKSWTLEDCLNYAMENSIDVKRSKNVGLSGLEDTRAAREAFFPSLSASSSQTVTGGPAQAGSGYTGSYSMNLSLPVYEGGSLRNTLKMAKVSDRINELGVEETRNSIRIAVIQAYMQILYASEALNTNRSTAESSLDRKNRAVEMFSAGMINKAELARLESEYESDMYQVTAAQSNLDNSLLRLKQLLELDISEEMNVEIPVIDESDIMVPLESREDIYEAALSSMPEMEIGRLNLENAQTGVKSAKSGYYPRISLSAGIGTQYNSSSSMSFGSQISNAFNQSAGLVISVPIYSNGSTRTSVRKAEIGVDDAMLDLAAREKELLSEVESVYLDILSYRSEYVSAKKLLESAEESYSLAEEQFLNGVSNISDMLDAKDNLLMARESLLQAKYMTLMNIKVLDIYRNNQEIR